MFYYVDRCFEEIVKVFKPKIPSARMYHEDSTTPRICLCKTIEGCMNAAPWGYNQISNRSEFEVFRLYVFDEEDILEENIIDSDILWKESLVPDAILTGEIWVTNQTLIPKKIEYFKIARNYFEDSVPILNPREHKVYIETGELPENFCSLDMIHDLNLRFFEEDELYFFKEFYNEIPEYLLLDLLPIEVEVDDYDEEKELYIFKSEMVVTLEDLEETMLCI